MSYKKFENGKLPCKLTKDQVRLLNNIGFEWRINSTYSADSWDDRYNESVSYVEDFGHARVPQKSALGCWMEQQRKQYKKNQNGTASCVLTNDQIRLLNVIGFEWSIHGTYNSVSWDCRYNELVS